MRVRERPLSLVCILGSSLSTVLPKYMCRSSCLGYVHVLVRPLSNLRSFPPHGAVAVSFSWVLVYWTWISMLGGLLRLRARRSVPPLACAYRAKSFVLTFGRPGVV